VKADAIGTTGRNDSGRRLMVLAKIAAGETGTTTRRGIIRQT